MGRIWWTAVVVAVLIWGVASVQVARAQSQASNEKVSTTHIKGIATSGGGAVRGRTFRAGDAIRNARP